MMGIKGRWGEELRCLLGREMERLERKFVLAGNSCPPPVLEILVHQKSEELTVVWKMFISSQQAKRSGHNQRCNGSNGVTKTKWPTAALQCLWLLYFLQKSTGYMPALQSRVDRTGL